MSVHEDDEAARGMSPEGVLILDLAHENAALRGALVMLLDAVRRGTGIAGAEAVALEVLQRFAEERVTTSPKPHRP